MIRTLRQGLRKTGKFSKLKLKAVVDNYNTMTHRGTNISPVEALKPENWKKIICQQNKYEKEFISKKDKKQIGIGETVFIENKNKTNKDAEIYKEKGKVIGKIGSRVFEILCENGKTIRRHKNQLKRFEGGMLDAPNVTSCFGKESCNLIIDNL